MGALFTAVLISRVSSGSRVTVAAYRYHLALALWLVSGLVLNKYLCE